MTIIHQTTNQDRVYTWPVDIKAAATVAAWVERQPELLDSDLSGMAEYFPHWLLVGRSKTKPARCDQCQSFGVPTTGALCCPICQQRIPADGLMWIGHLPVLARPEKKFRQRQEKLRQAGFAEVSTNQGQGIYLLVPLSLIYPQEWPNLEPKIHYSVKWLELMGLPRSSGTHHLLGKGKACIFSWQEWQAMPVHVVLQQRMVNHALSLFKIAAGQTPTQAFIGKGHHTTWTAGD